MKQKQITLLSVMTNFLKILVSSGSAIGDAVGFKEGMAADENSHLEELHDLKNWLKQTF